MLNNFDLRLPFNKRSKLYSKYDKGCKLLY